MFVRHHAQRLSRILLSEFALVHRVLVARTDGLLFFDSSDAEDAHAASAVAAAMLGLAEHVSLTHEHGEMNSAIVRSAAGVMIVYPAGPSHAMAVYAAPNVNLILLDRVARQLVVGLVRDEGATTARVPDGEPAAHQVPQSARRREVEEDGAVVQPPQGVAPVDEPVTPDASSGGGGEVVAVPVLSRRARREFAVRG